MGSCKSILDKDEKSKIVIVKPNLDLAKYPNPNPIRNVHLAPQLKPLKENGLYIKRHKNQTFSNLDINQADAQFVKIRKRTSLDLMDLN